MYIPVVLVIEINGKWYIYVRRLGTCGQVLTGRNREVVRGSPKRLV